MTRLKRNVNQKINAETPKSSSTANVDIDIRKSYGGINLLLDDKHMI